MNTLAFVGLVMLAEVFVVWVAYACGHAAGWLDGWEQRRGTAHFKPDSATLGREI